MKKIIGFLIIGIGLYLVLFSGWRIIRNSYLDKNWVVECEKRDFLKQNTDGIFDSEACITKIESNIIESETVFTNLLFVGLGLLLGGLIFFHRIIFTLFSETIKNKLLIIKAIEIFTNLSYWLLIGLVYMVMQLTAKGKISSCVVDSMFIFYIAGLTGFYSAYLILTNKYLINKELLKWIKGAMYSMLIGSLLAYFIPFYYKDILKLSIFTFFNLAFIQGFILMIFFIFANIMIGTIFKGFFNWIDTIFKK